jgi:predicted SprT family Zn-dependent metalloprotease
METDKAKELALSEMRKWGLLPTWKFRFNKRKRALGLCSPRDRTIYLSSYFLNKVSDAETLDTIRHEIAHALEAVRHGTSGHGPVWKAIAVEVGAKPERTCKVAIRHTYPYVIKYEDRVVKGFFKLPKDIWDRLPNMSARGVPESKGKLKLYRVSYKRVEETHGA